MSATLADILAQQNVAAVPSVDLGGGDLVYTIIGPGYTTQIAFQPDGTPVDSADQQAVDDLADPDEHAERLLQTLSPEAVEARAELVAAGYTITRPDPALLVFEADDGSTVTTDLDPDELAALAGLHEPTIDVTPEGIIRTSSTGEVRQALWRRVDVE